MNIHDKAVRNMINSDNFQATDYPQGYADGYKAGSNYRELGCEGCAFESTEEWEMPCAKCMRNCKDYYRRPREEK